MKHGKVCLVTGLIKIQTVLNFYNIRYAYSFQIIYTTNDNLKAKMGSVARQSLINAHLYYFKQIS